MLKAQSPGYGGPGLATRGMRQAGVRGSEPVSLRPYVNVLGSYDNGLTAVGLTQDGEIVNPGGLFGVEASFGVYGTRSWKRSTLGMDYQGNYRHYSKNTYFDGSDHLLGLDYTRQLNRRAEFQLRTMAGTTSRTVGGTFGLALADPSFLGVPVNDIFDNRTYFLESMGAVSLQVKARNMVTFGGSGFAVRRQSRALVGLNGHRAFGEFSRRISRRSTVGVNYQYFHVDYPRAFGEADVHALLLEHRREIGRRWALALGGGVYMIDFAGIRTVEVDPVIVELFGITTGREAFNQKTATSAFQVSLARTFRRSLFGISYIRGANPGTGALLLNRQDAVRANFTYTASSRWSLSGAAGYFSAAGYGTYNDRYETFTAGFLASHNLAGGLYFTTGLEGRRIEVTSATFRRFGTRVFAGLTYSPGSLPVALR